ncbi:protein AkeP [Flagelloscypha sp. PMI_526]|nr:protein AkeP [Flagelloscypha sp. PMI_526]
MYSSLLLVFFSVPSFAAPSSGVPAAFQTYQKSFASLIGAQPKITLLANTSESLFHEAAVYHPPTKSLFVTSDHVENPGTNSTKILLTHVSGLNSPNDVKIQTMDTDIPNVDSGYYRPTPHSCIADDTIVMMGQGNMSVTPGVYLLNPRSPFNTTKILDSYGGYTFNSVNDVVIAKDGSIWFTDPIYGFVEGETPAALLPNQVYRFDPCNGSVKVVADQLIRPNGIAINADDSVIYIGDVGASPGDGSLDVQGPRTIYAYDHKGTFLQNRRVFAMPDGLKTGVDGMKVDNMGNVWGGVTGEGVSVWDKDGILLGKIALDGNIANLGFGEPGELFVMGGNYLWRVDLAPFVKGSTS